MAACALHLRLLLRFNRESVEGALSACDAARGELPLDQVCFEYASGSCLACKGTNCTSAPRQGQGLPGPGMP